MNKKKEEMLLDLEACKKLLYLKNQLIDTLLDIDKNNFAQRANYIIALFFLTINSGIVFFFYSDILPGMVFFVSLLYFLLTYAGFYRIYKIRKGKENFIESFKRDLK